MGELARALGRLQAQRSSVVHLLVQRGLVARQGGDSDRRIVRVVPTDLGIAEHEAISAAWAAPLEDALADLTDDERAALLNSAGALGSVQRALRRRAGEMAGSWPLGRVRG